MVSGCVGCTTQPLDARSRFVEDGVRLESDVAWSGEKFVVNNTGVAPTGGLSIASNNGRSRVLAVARMLAVASTLDKPSADEAIRAAKATFAVTPSSVRCGEGRSSAGDTGGCDALDVSLPEGTPQQPLSLSALSGNGSVSVSLGTALAELDVHGSRGAIEITVPATKGAIVSITADTGDDILLRLPRDFAADVITLDTSGAIDSAAFPDVRSGQGRGIAGEGAKSITLRSARTGNAGGRIVLLAQ